MQRLGHPARKIPHTADKGQFDNLPGSKMFFHRLKNGFILLGPPMSYLIGPPDSRFFFVGKEIAIPPVITIKQVNLSLR